MHVLIVVVIILETPLVCPTADAVTVVLFDPVGFPAFAVTRRVAKVLAPGVNITDTGVTTEGT